MEDELKDCYHALQRLHDMLLKEKYELHSTASTCRRLVLNSVGSAMNAVSIMSEVLPENAESALELCRTMGDYG